MRVLKIILINDTTNKKDCQVKKQEMGFSKTILTVSKFMRMMIMY